MQSTVNSGHTPTNPSGNGMPRTDLIDRLEAAKKEAIAILQDPSTWPSDSTVLVKELLEMIRNAPTLQDERLRSLSITSQAQGSIEGFTSVMEDVSARLNKTYRKYGSNRELSDVIKYPFASLSKDGCPTALLKCKNDVAKALTSLRDRLEDSATASKDSRLIRTSSTNGFTVEHSVGSGYPENDTGTTSVFNAPTTEPILSETPDLTASTQQPTSNEQSALPTDQHQLGEAAARRRERLDIACTTLEAVETISGTIPVVGSYIGAGAKVGLAVVKMIQ
ncbi:hypothetical protein FRC01_000585, partial [Tulasnella sp. 417]